MSHAEGITHSIQAKNASQMSTLIGNFQLLWKSSYTNAHSYTTQHIHRYMQCPSWSQMHTFAHRHTCTTVEISGLLLSYLQIPSTSFCYLNPHFLPKRPSIQRKRANLGGLRTFTDMRVCKTRRSLLTHQKETPEGNSHQSLTREAVNWGLIAQLSPGRSGGSILGVQRG